MDAGRVKRKGTSRQNCRYGCRVDPPQVCSWIAGSRLVSSADRLVRSSHVSDVLTELNLYVCCNTSLNEIVSNQYRNDLSGTLSCTFQTYLGTFAAPTEKVSVCKMRTILYQETFWYKYIQLIKLSTRMNIRSYGRRYSSYR